MTPRGVLSHAPRGPGVLLALLTACTPDVGREPPARGADDSEEPAPSLRVRGLCVEAYLPQNTFPEGPVRERDGRQHLVLVQSSGPAPEQPLVGRYRMQGQTLSFCPRMRPSALHELEARRLALGEVIERVTIPARDHEAGDEERTATRITSMEPRRALVPQNMLRFYVDFSRPMRGGRAMYDAIHLVDLDRGEEVAGAWRHLQLWSPDRTRLTLLIHPGRVKRDISYAAAVGPALREGGRYALRIDHGLNDAQGEPLAADYEWIFQTGPADHEGPRPERWVIDAPATASREPLVVHFDEALDGEFVARRLRVTRAGAGVTGEATRTPAGDSWTFVPAEAWADAEHVLDFTPGLEDLAGNTQARAFDHRVGEPPREVANTLAFRPRI